MCTTGSPGSATCQSSQQILDLSASIISWANSLWSLYLSICISSAQLLIMSDSLQPHRLQQARPPCPPATPAACSNSCPSSRWYHPTTSSSIVPFSFCLQFFPALGSFPGEGNGNPCQYSWLENPVDGGAWWAAVYGVSQRQTQLKRLSSSSRAFSNLHI